MTGLEAVAARLAAQGRYRATLDEDTLRVENAESGSEYILEIIEGSIQVRQAVHFECFSMRSSDLANIYAMCSALNERFSGCKSFIDRWGVLITAADILDGVREHERIETVLNQVEFMSLGTLQLLEVVLGEQRPASQEEVDAALAAPPLH